MSRFWKYDGIDCFRLVAAFLVVGIHTYPLASVSTELNFLLVHIVSRIAVPFFLMATGYFLLPPYFSREGQSREPLIRFVKKASLLYAGTTLLYLPISIYAGQYSDGNALLIFARNLVFDGTFYHLWYLPAVIMGTLLVYVLSRKHSLRLTFCLAICLYLLGLFGDSYNRLIVSVPFLRAVYDFGFHIFPYTRNGVFYAPVFLTLGVVIAKQERPVAKRTSVIGLILSMALLVTEGMLLAHFVVPRHTSMYLMLVPCMFFLFSLVQSRPGKRSLFLRDASIWIYMLHPLFIIGVRGGARALGLTELLVGNSVVFFLVVSGLSFACAILFWMWKRQRQSLSFQKGRAWIELDMESLRHNVKTLRHILPDRCQLMPAVKANAYGHGAVAICRELNALGVRAFCVASVMEGVALRKRHIKGKILVLGYTHPEQLHLLKRYRLAQTVIDFEYAKTLNDYGKRLRVHIGVDTGMRRLGERSENIDNILEMFKFENLVIDGIYSHFSLQSDAFTQTQVERFRTVLTAIEAHGFSVPHAHLQGSYGVLSRPDLSFDYARVGIALYGAAEHTCEGVTLRPVLSVKARVSTVKAVFAGEAVGYGLAFVAPDTMKIAVLSIGYADGVPRSLSCGTGGVLINGSAASIVGYVCMDQTIVDVTHIADVKQGDIAVVIGQDGDREISAIDIAKQTGTVPNEVLSRLGSRMPVVVKGTSN